MHDPREHIAQANRHVVEADERIARQRQRIEHQRRAARDTEDSEDLLRLLLETRELMVAHQKLLEREMAIGARSTPNTSPSRRGAISPYPNPVGRLNTLPL